MFTASATFSASLSCRGVLQFPRPTLPTFTTFRACSDESDTRVAPRTITNAFSGGNYPLFEQQQVQPVQVQAAVPNFETVVFDKRNRNAVTLIGHIGSDPEMRTFDNGNCVVRFPLALNRGAPPDEITEWYDVESWSDLGERCFQHLRKGAHIHLYGRMKVDKWQDKQTQADRKRVVIVAESISHVVHPATFGNLPQVRVEAGNFVQDSTQPVQARLTRDQLWAEYQASPSSFHDNRTTKLKPSQPDFVHKGVGRQGLWTTSAPPGIEFPPAEPPF